MGAANTSVGLDAAVVVFPGGFDPIRDILGNDVGVDDCPVCMGAAAWPAGVPTTDDAGTLLA